MEDIEDETTKVVGGSSLPQHELDTSTLLPTSPSEMFRESEFLVESDVESIDIRSNKPYSFTDGTNFEIGQHFKSKDELKNMLLDAAIKNCFEMKIVKSCKKVFVVDCVDREHCSWHLRAVKLANTNFFSIRTHHNVHTCSLDKRKKKHRQASAAMVAEVVKKNFQEIKQTPTPKGIMGMMNSQGVEISYWKAWRGKQLANNLRRGSPEESYNLLPSYLYMLKKVNPGTITHLELDEYTRLFFHSYLLQLLILKYIMCLLFIIFTKFYIF